MWVSGNMQPRLSSIHGCGRSSKYKLSANHFGEFPQGEKGYESNDRGSFAGTGSATAGADPSVILGLTKSYLAPAPTAETAADAAEGMMAQAFQILDEAVGSVLQMSSPM